ncbi:uncharacterized protein MELLADRAFT_123875 [Melampsora larici-populina 98AG31]|uniref:Secreted protein n=1 Tax=Melampsora larici-populina (strain 98AG31 / pathotype 3-4-7) TaxID=747676 RepID=F4RBT1_MELLP|nr:uncharacterized protein MELLADRAFT_123875 [Melampsora larici-populina 98AG31]EGG10157.1 secreted protein [Melampsora larici-populina 98AG31]
MSWKLANSILYIAIGFLLAGDFGWKIFAHADSIECDYTWSRPEPWNNHMHLCATNTGARTMYTCSWCGRGDTKLPSAYYCVDELGTLVTKYSWDCDAGMDVNDDPTYSITCKRTVNGTPVDYRCKSRHLNQQCPTNLCKAYE